MSRLNKFPSDEGLALLAGYFSALADPLRLKLVRALMQGERNVNFLVEFTGGEQSNVSRNLGKLTTAGLLHRRKQGVQVMYSIADPSIYDLCDKICGTLEKRLAQQAKVIGQAGNRGAPIRNRPPA